MSSPNTSEVLIAFFRGGSWNIADNAVRVDTRRPGQPLSDVPAHVSLIVGGMLCEFISSGYHSRPATDADYEWAYPVTVPDKAGLMAFIQAQSGKQYAWLTILLIALSRFIPGAWLRGTRNDQKRICSWFARTALEAGGWNCPLWLRKQYVPESPNDLLYAATK